MGIRAEKAPLLPGAWRQKLELAWRSYSGSQELVDSDCLASVLLRWLGSGSGTMEENQRQSWSSCLPGGRMPLPEGKSLSKVSPWNYTATFLWADFNFAGLLLSSLVKSLTSQGAFLSCFNT